jgi:density-regulated protein DRP1
MNSEAYGMSSDSDEPEVEPISSDPFVSGGKCRLFYWAEVDEYTLTDAWTPPKRRKFPGGKHVAYCPRCTFPPELCCYNGYDELPPEPPADGEGGAAGGEAAAEAEEEEAGGGKKKKKKKQRGAKKPKAKGGKVGKMEIVLTRVQRTKRKYCTTVLGTDAFGHKLKEMSKALGKKFACGCSINKKPDGTSEIVVQGDVAFEVAELLTTKYAIPEEKIYAILTKGGKKKLLSG